MCCIDQSCHCRALHRFTVGLEKRYSAGMSMDDLPDLLAELAQGIGGGENPGLNPDVERIAALWLQEESSPEILPFQSETVQDLYELVRPLRRAAVVA